MTDLPETYWDDEAQDWLPVPDRDTLFRHNLKMRSFLRALAGGHTLEPEKLAEAARKALQVPQPRDGR